VGGGLAGAQAAEALRTEGFHARVMLDAGSVNFHVVLGLFV